VLLCLCVLLLQFPYIEAVVRESLRLYPPATLLNRRVKAGGFALTPNITVPEGEGVFPFLYGYQRSPEYWPAAEEYRPERWLPEGQHLAPITPDAWTPFGRCALCSAGLTAHTASCKRVWQCLGTMTA
jgi:cytochrome P450